MEWSPRRRWRVALTALIGELVLNAALILFPANHRQSAWGYLEAPFILPGFLVVFVTGGGMSGVDGLTPSWLMCLALTLGYVVNAAVLYPLLLIGVSGYRELKLELGRQRS